MKSEFQTPSWRELSKRDESFEEQVYNSEFFEELARQLNERFPEGWTQEYEGKVYCTVDSTTGWGTALKRACEKTKHLSFWEYWVDLAWFDSDLCDEDLSEALIAYLAEKV